MQELAADRSVGDRGDDPQRARLTPRASLHVEGKDALEQTRPVPLDRDRDWERQGATLRRDRTAFRVEVLLAGGGGDGATELAAKGWEIQTQF